jgi:thiol-disulfide isomerase/thioredoxin
MRAVSPGSRYDTSVAKPAVFAELDFEAALSRSRDNQSVLIIDAMATWCGPCRQMDGTTWVDPAVVARLSGGSSSFAIQIDVDREQEIAAQLEVSAMPTLIAFVNGAEHDRLVGGRGPGDLIEWLDIVERGDRYEDAQRAARVLLQERRTRAATLLATKQYDKALLDYTWLWTEARSDSIVAEIRELVAAHAPARTAFTELRDAAAPAGEPPHSLEAVFAWMMLSQVIGDDDAILRWYDANVAELPPSRAVAHVVELAVVPMLIERARWADAGIALADPVATFSRLVKSLPAAELPREAGNLVRALYAAGREERANDVEFEARSADPSVEMAAVLATAKTLGRDDRGVRMS